MTDFEKKAGRLADELRKPAMQAERAPLMQRVTFAVLAEAQPLTPVRTGTLRRSEATRVEAEGQRGYVYSRVLYAPYVHARVPFFDRGLERARPKIDRLMEQAGLDYMGRLANNT